jgi:hypothetical protein
MSLFLVLLPSPIDLHNHLDIVCSEHDKGIFFMLLNTFSFRWFVHRNGKRLYSLHREIVNSEKNKNNIEKKWRNVTKKIALDTCTWIMNVELILMRIILWTVWNDLWHEKLKKLRTRKLRNKRIYFFSVFTSVVLKCCMEIFLNFPHFDPTRHEI